MSGANVKEDRMQTDEEIAREIVGGCSCHAAYTDRKLIDHACAFHSYAEDIAAALRRVREETLEEAARTIDTYVSELEMNGTPELVIVAARAASRRVHKLMARASNAPQEGE